MFIAALFEVLKKQNCPTFNRRVVKKTMVHTNHGILFSKKKEQNIPYLIHATVSITFQGYMLGGKANVKCYVHVHLYNILK